MAVAGLCYLIYPAILMPAGLAELSLMIWLIAAGVNIDRWNEQSAGDRFQAREHL